MDTNFKDNVVLKYNLTEELKDLSTKKRNRYSALLFNCCL